MIAVVDGEGEWGVGGEGGEGGGGVLLWMHGEKQTDRERQLDID